MPSLDTWIAGSSRRAPRRHLRGARGGQQPRPGGRRGRRLDLRGRLKDIVAVLANADPEDKRAIYDELGVNLTYHSDGRVHVAPARAYLGCVSEGGL